MTLSISLPLYLDDNNFGLTITAVDPTLYSISIKPQTPSRLTEVDCLIEYQTDIAQKSIELSYSQQRRRLERVEPGWERQLQSISFQLTMKIDSFPPATYIPEPTLSFYQLTNSMIGYLALVFMVVNVIIVPKRYAVHSVSLTWIVPYLYLAYFQSTAYSNEWISSTIRNTKYQALVGGISLGKCCEEDTFMTTTSQTFANVGFIFAGLIAGWSVFGVSRVISYCSPSEKAKNVSNLIRYYLFTVHLIVFLQVGYFSLDGLIKYKLSNQLDAANTTISLFFFFLYAFMTGSLWYLTGASKF